MVAKHTDTSGQNNRIGEDGAGALAAALHKNHSLASLSLDVRNAMQWPKQSEILTRVVQDNRIGEVGARAMAAALETIVGLALLDLGVRL